MGRAFIHRKKSKNYQSERRLYIKKIAVHIGLSCVAVLLIVCASTSVSWSSLSFCIVTLSLMILCANDCFEPSIHFSLWSVYQGSLQRNVFHIEFTGMYQSQDRSIPSFAVYILSLLITFIWQLAANLCRYWRRWRFLAVFDHGIWDISTMVAKSRLDQPDASRERASS